jgi:hypothetical protein
LAHNTTISVGSGGDTIVDYDLATGGAYPTTGKVPAGVVYVSANSTTAPTPVTDANGFPVRPATSTTWVVGDGGGSLTVDGTVAVSGTVAISAAALPLPSGAATAAKQPALGAAGTPSTDVVTVQGIASMTALKVDGSAVTQPVSGTITVQDGGGSLTVDGTVAATQSGAWAVTGSGVFNVRPASPAAGDYLPVRLTDGTAFYSATGGGGGGGGQQYNEDAAHTSGDLGSIALAVRKDIAAQLAGTDGDYSVLLTDASGRLHVNVGNTVAVSGPLTDAQLRATAVPVSLATVAVTNAGTFAVQVSAALPAGTNTVGAVNLAQYAPSSGRLPVDGSGVTQPISGTVTANAGSGTFAVSAASLPLPSGAATAARQPALGTAGTASADVLTVQGVASMTPLSVSVSGTPTVTGAGGTFPVTDSGGSLTIDAPVGTPVFVRLSDGSAALGGSGNPLRTDPTGSTTQPVSAASLPLPTGASTATNQTTANTSLASIDGKVTACNTGAVVVSAALPAGTNTIGAITGPAAHDAVVSGAPLLLGAEARESNGTPVQTGDAVRVAADRLGRLLRASPKLTHASSNGTPITTATDTTIVAAPSTGSHLVPHRVQIANAGATATWVYLRDGASGTKLFGAYLSQGATAVLRFEGIWHLTTATALVLNTSAAGSVEWTASTETIAD